MSKLKSRKLWISVLTMVGSIAGALVGLGGQTGTVACVIGAIVSPMIYVLTEGHIDAKAVKLTEDAVEDILQKLGYLESAEESEENENE